MVQREIFPQSIADIRTIIMKPRFDQREIQFMCETVKSRLFSKGIFKPKAEDIKLLACEKFFEPYLIIEGKYVLDYCKKHVFRALVDKKTTSLFIAGEEIHPKQSEQQETKSVIKVAGEEHLRYEKKTFYILDRFNREIPPEELPFSPFSVQQKDFELKSNFRKIQVPDEKQIEFLKTKIAHRPAEAAEIIREVFDITDRTIAYYPVYQITFENAKKRQENTVTIDGITGEIMLIGSRSRESKTIITSRENLSVTPFTFPIALKEDQSDLQIEPIMEDVSNFVEEEPKTSKKNDNIVEFPTSSATCEEMPREQVQHVDAKITVNDDSNASKRDHALVLKEERKIIPQRNNAVIGSHAFLPTTPSNVEDLPEQDQKNQSTQSEEKTIPSQGHTKSLEPILVIVPDESIDRTQNVLEEEANNSAHSEAEEKMILGFPARIIGQVIDIMDNVATIDGDVEIPSGTYIDKNLVVKGTLKIGDCCVGRGKLKLKATKEINIGADTIIKGELISEGDIYVGKRSLIIGTVHASRVFTIEEYAVVEAIPSPSTPSC